MRDFILKQVASIILPLSVYMGFMLFSMALFRRRFFAGGIIVGLVLLLFLPFTALKSAVQNCQRKLLSGQRALVLSGME